MNVPTIKRGIWILCAASGMGKSTVTSNLEHMFKRKYRGYSIYRLPAKLVNSIYLKEGELDLEDILHSLDRFPSPNLKSQILNKRVMLLLDGYDEIDKDVQAEAAEFIKKVASLELPLWITTRPHRLQEIRDIIPMEYKEIIMVLEILPFDRQKQLQVIQSLLKKTPAECNASLQALEAKTTPDFLGNPLHLYLLVTSLGEGNPDNLYNLYDAFVTSKIKRALNGDSSEFKILKVKNWLKQALTLEDAAKLTEEQKETITRTGILEFTVNGNECSTFHFSILEFLHCLKIIDQFKKVDGDFVRIDSPKIRLFIDGFFADADNRNKYSKVEKFNTKILEGLFKDSVAIITRICEEGLLNFYNFLSDIAKTNKQFRDTIWNNDELFKKHSAKLFFLASCSNLDLMNKLIERGATVQRMLKTLVQKNKLFAVVMLEVCCLKERINFLQQILSVDFEEVNFSFERDVFQNSSARDLQLHEQFCRARQSGSSWLYDFLSAPQQMYSTVNAEEQVEITLFAGLQLATSEEVTKILLKSGANVNGKRPGDLATPLQIAAMIANLSVLGVLLKCKEIKINDRCVDGSTALHLAASKSLEACKILLESGADAYVTDLQGRTILHRAIFAGNLECVKYFVEKWPNLVKTSMNSLVMASEGGHLEIVKVLTLVSNIKDQKAACIAAAFAGHSDIVRFLVNVFDDLSELAVAMNIAISSQKYNVVLALLENGYKVNLEDPFGSNALQFAAMTGLDMFLMILEQGPELLTVENPLGWNVLIFSTIGGAADVIKYLLDSKVFDVDEKIGSKGVRALHFAAINGHLAALQTLIEAGCNTEATTTAGCSALHGAAEKNHTECVELLLKTNANLINVKSIHEKTALHFAACNANPQKLKVQVRQQHQIPLQAGENTIGITLPDIRFRTEFTNSPTKSMKPEVYDPRLGEPLDFTADWQQLPTVKMLVDYGADLEAKDCYGMTPLHLCCRFGTLECVKFLFEKCQRMINEVTLNGDTVLHLAVANVDENIAKFLLENGADPKANNKNMNNVLHRALLEGTVSTVNLLLDYFPQTSFKDSYEYFAFAAGNLDPDVLARINELLKKECGNSYKEHMTTFTHEKGPDGHTALHLAVIRGSPKSVMFLLESGSDPNAQDRSGQTPWHFAAMRNDTLILETLPQSGADFHIPNKDGAMALHVAVEISNIAFVRFVLDAKIYKGNEKQCITEATPLHIAAYYGNLELVKLLLKYGCSLHTFNKHGESVLHSAVNGKLDNHDTEAVARHLAPLHKKLLHQRDKNSQTPLQAAKANDLHSLADILKRFQL